MTSRSSRSARTTSRWSATPVTRSTASGRSATSSPTRTSTRSSRRSRTSTASRRTEELLRTIDDGLVFTNLVETDSLWGHRNDPVNFHRCLQDFDRRLPDLLDALRPNDLLILTSDHGCDPTTPSTDHSREHALLLAYVEGRNAGGRHPRGRRVRRRRRDGQRLARRQERAARCSWHAVRRALSRSTTRRLVASEYADESRPARARGRLRGRRYGDDARVPVVDVVVASARPPCVLEVGCGWGELAEWIARETGGEGRGDRPLAAHGRAGARARDRCARRRRAGAAVRGRGVRPRRRGVDALPRSGSRPWRSRRSPRVLRPGGTFVAATNSRFHLQELRELVGSGPSTLKFAPRTAKSSGRRTSSSTVDVAALSYVASGLLTHRSRCRIANLRIDVRSSRRGSSVRRDEGFMTTWDDPLVRSSTATMPIRHDTCARAYAALRTSPSLRRRRSASTTIFVAAT